MKINSLKFNNSTIHKMYHGDELVNKIGDAFTYMEASGDTPTPPTPVPYDEQYFTIESTSDNNTISFTMGNRMPTAITTAVTSVSVSTDDGSTWEEMQNIGNGASLSVTLNAGDKAIWKGEAVRYAVADSTQLDRQTIFSSTGQFKVYGNIMSLLSGDNFEDAETLTEANTFCALFSGCIGLTSAENLILPATTLAEGCYSQMFEYCTSLIKAPKLPATTLGDACYAGMFYYCESLTTAPELPAETLANDCYNSMFFYCTSLTTAPELPATTLATGCYRSMFSICTNLTTAPELPAETLANDCYNQMFQSCTSLTTAPVLPATTLANTCYNQMFYYCTSLTTAPELPATTLTTLCYSFMFAGCRSLNYIKCLATDISATNCTKNWVYNVASTGTFVKAASMSSWTTGSSGIPTNWTVQNDR